MTRSSMRRLAFSCALLTAVLSGTACRRSGATEPPEKDGAADPADATAGTGALDEGKATSRLRGVAHSGNINTLAVCPDGTCALSRDEVGGVRLWMTLDGSSEPQPISAGGTAHLSIARIDEQRVLFSVVDPSGGARIFEADAQGRQQVRAELPPFEPILEAHALAGGRGVLVLRKDRSIRLLDAAGAELATFDERKFRPDRLLVSEDGKVAVAVLSKVAPDKAFDAELVRLAITQGEQGTPGIERLGSPRLAEGKTAISPSSVSLSSDGNKVAFVDETSGQGWKIQVLDLSDPEKDRLVLVSIPTHVVPMVGFVGSDRLLAGSADGSLSWLHELSDLSKRPREAAPQDFNHQGKVSLVRGGVQVMGYGTWLFVHEVQRRRHRFLGYDLPVGQSTAVSPSGEHVAWGFNQGPIVVEAVDPEASPRSLELHEGFEVGVWRLRFIDEDHLLAADTLGHLTLIDWKEQRVVARAGLSGSLRNLQYEPSSGLLLAERHNGDARIFRVDADAGFDGPWLVADNAYRFGLLSPASVDEPVLWSIDGGNRLRHYTMRDLEADLDQDEILARGENLQNGQPAPMAIDERGRRYGVRWSDGKMEVFVAEGERVTAQPASGNDVSMVVPGPGGSRVAMVTGRGTTSAISVHDGGSLEPLWSFALGGFQNEVTWSPDGRYLTISGNSGSIVLDGEDGDPVVQRCGREFRVLQAPPASAFGGSGQRSLCES